MDIQCSACAFRGIFIGSFPPKKCPSCLRNTVTAVSATTNCLHCSKESPVTDTACAHCGVERVSRKRTGEDDQAPAPDNIPVPRDHRDHGR